jgi:hypothetical protein
LGIPLHGLKRGKDDDIEAPILRASGRGVVAGNWMKLAVTCGRQVTRWQLKLHDHQPDHFRGPSRRKLPIRRKVRIVNGDVIGMALDAKILLPLL